MSAYLPWLTETFDDALTGLTIKAMLMGPTWVPDQLAEFRADISADEVAGTGYTAGGVTVTGVTVTQVDLDLTVKIDFADVAYGVIDIADIAGIVLYVSTGVAATDVLIGYDTFTSSTAGGADFNYRPHADGFLLVSAP